MRTRPVVLYSALSLALLLAGAGLRGLGHLRQQGVNAHRQLLAMRYNGLPSQYDALAQSITYGSRLPWFSEMQTSIEEQRAESRYWQHDYHSLELTPDASGGVAEHDPEILLIAANAAYRRIRLDPTDRTIVEQLQAVIGQYGEVLKRDPELLDAAYNYEFTARIRDLFTRPHGNPLKVQNGLAKPPEHSIHGRPGAAPVRTDMGKFKMVIPQRPDERNTAPQSGTSGLKLRKG